MFVQLHGFDWAAYAGHIMPALARWLIEEDEVGVYRFYKYTRCAREEQYTSASLQLLRTWPRARTFVKQLPRSPRICREYEQLCSTEQFTALSDRYVHRHPPQLHAPSEALLTLWGALVEEYCLPWSRATRQEAGAGSISQQEQLHKEPDARLSAGRNDLAREVHENSDRDTANNASLQTMLSSLLNDNEDGAASGVLLGRQPTQLHLRGWLSSLSIRAMVLFELLVCERRTMPFGYQPGAPFGAFVGYLTAEEVEQLALCLRDVQPPDRAEAKLDYEHFRRAQQKAEAPRVIDEVLPAHADIFLKAVHIAAQQRLGLICSVS